jgi:SAM-dependent methyltransferase
MAPEQQNKFCQKIKNNKSNYFVNKKILEIGSFNINGTVRDLFENCSYIGLDIAEGSGVDVVCEAQKYDAPNNYFDTIISCECFEHNPFYIETINNAIRMLKSKGLFLFTCATIGRPVHGVSSLEEEGKNKHKSWITMPNVFKKDWNNEYYKNVSIKDILDNIDIDLYFHEYSFSIDHEKHDLYFYGVKK